jgi:XTP/dITP diphosphohydrolase
MKLYIATTNPGKLRDFAAAASQLVTIEPLPGIQRIAPPPEDESSFEGNARTKATFYSYYLPGQIVIADDSGLEVDALDRAPGVRSARYAEDHSTDHPLPSSAPTNIDERNNLCLLQALAKLPNHSSKARYRCVLAAARNGKILGIGNGTVEGEILPSPRGTEGFGYDPLFYLPTHNKTMAELALPTKLLFSHRGRALTALLEALPLPQLPKFQGKTT